jgi:hypothetical protein
MAINVNKVYKSVLSILNKEERGYLTPYEFNNLARQAQLELLDGLFYQYNQFLNIENINRTNEGYADLAEKIQEQIDEHYKSAELTPSSGKVTVPTDAYRILDVTMRNHGLKVEKIDKVRLPFLKSSPLTRPSSTFPIYYQEATEVVFDPSITENVSINYVAKPSDPRFGYTVNTQYGTEIYDANPFVDGGVILGDKSLGIISASSNLNNGTFNVTDTSGLQLTIVISSSAVTSLTVTAAGSGLSVGDTITIDSASLGGGTASITLTLRVQDMYATTNQGSTDFTLHESLEPNLISSILGYAGLIIKDPSIVQGITQLATADAMNKRQQ